MRPSCAATTDAFGELIRSISCSGAACLAAPCPPPAAAAGVGAVAALAACSAPLATAVAPAVAVELEAPALCGDEASCEAPAASPATAPHVTCLPEIGRRPSVRP